MSWSLGKVSDIADIISGYAFKTDCFGTGNDKIIKIGNLQNGRITNNDLMSFDSNIYKVSEQFKIQTGDILMALSGATVGKIAIAQEKDSGSYLNQRVAIVRGNSPENAQYLKYVFSGHLLEKLLLFAGGAAQPNLSPKSLADMEIPLPPLDEQKRIAAILDKADSLRRKRQQAIQLADEFLRAVFLDLFGDPVTNPKGWNVKPICNIATVKTGNTPSRTQPEYYGDYIEWIKSDNINTPHHILTTAREYLSEEGCAVGRKVSVGATLITCIAGSFDCIGNVAFTDRDVCFNQQINALIPLTVKPWFLYALILFSKKKIQAASTNSMKGMVSKGVLEKIELICPPIELQIKFEKLFENYRNLMLKNEQSKYLADNSFNSLSQKAFAGEL